MWTTKVLHDFVCKSADSRLYCQRGGTKMVEWLEKDKYSDRYPSISMLRGGANIAVKLTAHMMQSPVKGMAAFWDLRAVQEP